MAARGVRSSSCRRRRRRSLRLRSARRAAAAVRWPLVAAPAVAASPAAVPLRPHQHRRHAIAAKETAGPRTVAARAVGVVSRRAGPLTAGRPIVVAAPATVAIAAASGVRTTGPAAAPRALLTAVLFARVALATRRVSSFALFALLLQLRFLRPSLLAPFLQPLPFLLAFFRAAPLIPSAHALCPASPQRCIINRGRSAPCRRRRQRQAAGSRIVAPLALAGAGARPRSRPRLRRRSRTRSRQGARR